jgi:eukaryotic-like serine/threonine-protein kinase
LKPEKFSRLGNAIKWPSSVSAQEKNRQILEFQQEAEFLSRCAHPKIVEIYDYFEENNTSYIVTEMLSGKSLTEILKQKGKIPAKKVRHYFIQVGEALEKIHSVNLLHRDINSNNIIVDSQDNIKLIDFGNAREFILGQSTDMPRTITPGYAPLEQYVLRAKRGPSTDIAVPSLV